MKAVFIVRTFVCFALGLALAATAVAQKGTATSGVVKAPVQKVLVGSPTVTRVDLESFKKLLKPAGRPLLINFWATWCDPCRDEFPDLIKIDADYKGRIDFLIVSLDDVSDINTLVPKFLNEMKAEMPAYLLHTPDESAAISAVSKDWQGNLPLTILYSADGKTAYLKKGKVRYAGLAAELDKVLLTSQKSAGTDQKPVQQ